MKVFEDLIEELKEENLLEQTVTQSFLTPESFQEKKLVPHEKFTVEHRVDPTDFAPTKQTSHENSGELIVDARIVEENDVTASFVETAPSDAPAPVTDRYKTTKLSLDDLPQFEAPAPPEPIVVEPKFESPTVVEPSAEIPKIIEETQPLRIVGGAGKGETTPLESFMFDVSSESEDSQEFYRRRVMSEVTSLQLVEHVLTGVERDQMKRTPKGFDDISVKMALHDFLTVSKETNDSLNAQAEFRLMQETANWCTALSYRDEKIPVSELRRYCETTRPILSRQALEALAKFYRNLPYTNAVRAKFEMVLTRMFAVEDDQDRRQLICDRDAIVEEVSNFYAEWASVPIYSDSDETRLLLINLKFNDLLAEVAAAETFDELVKKDFYNRLRQFKEEIGDKFYAPQVLASAIECNIIVGNRYVELLMNEKKNATADDLQNKYGVELDATVSEAAEKTLKLAELLAEKRVKDPKKLNETKENFNVAKSSNGIAGKRRTAAPAKKAAGLFGVRPWALAVLIITVLVTAGLYVFTEFGVENTVSAEVQRVNLENSSFKEFVDSARISGDLMIGITNENWITLSEEKRQEVLAKLLTIGKEKGYKKVQMLDNKGAKVGYADEKQIIASLKSAS